MKTIGFGLLLLLILGFTVQENNVDGLRIEFKKVTYVSSYSYDGTSYLEKNKNPLTLLKKEREMPHEGFIFEKLKLKLTNVGKTDCIFDCNHIFISTKKDSLYPFSFTDNRILTGMGLNTATQVKIQPNETITKTLYFEFPDDEAPNEIYIENRKFKIIKE
jgi:hypothetical protein